MCPAKIIAQGDLVIRSCTFDADHVQTKLLEKGRVIGLFLTLELRMGIQNGLEDKPLRGLGTAKAIARNGAQNDVVFICLLDRIRDGQGGYGPGMGFKGMKNPRNNRIGNSRPGGVMDQNNIRRFARQCPQTI